MFETSSPFKKEVVISVPNDFDSSLSDSLPGVCVFCVFMEGMSYISKRCIHESIFNIPFSTLILLESRNIYFFKRKIRTNFAVENDVEVSLNGSLGHSLKQ